MLTFVSLPHVSFKTPCVLFCHEYVVYILLGKPQAYSYSLDHEKSHHCSNH